MSRPDRGDMANAGGDKPRPYNTGLKVPTEGVVVDADTPVPQPQAGSPLTGRDILANARALADRIRERDLAARYDELRSLPEDIVAEIRDAGIMRMNMPRIWGGPEMTAMEQVEVIEALSRADASVGWCAFIWADSGIYSGYLDDAVAREMYPRLDMATSGWVHPAGTARRAPGGYRMSGRWMFGSGCGHCDWLVAGCTVVEEDGSVARGADGRAPWRILYARPDDYEIEDTWYTTGLRGTGSNDYRCEDLFVPEERSFSLLEPARRAGTIWARPDHFLRKTAGVPLGIAQETIDVCRRMFSEGEERGTGRPLRDVPRIRAAVAEARVTLGAARSYLFESLERLWGRLERHERPTAEERADAWLSRTNAFQAGRRVVALLYDTIGGSAIYSRRSPLDRHLRDIQTACQHILGQTKMLEDAGSLLLGGEHDQPLM